MMHGFGRFINEHGGFHIGWFEMNAREGYGFSNETLEDSTVKVGYF